MCDGFEDLYVTCLATIISSQHGKARSRISPIAPEWTIPAGPPAGRRRLEKRRAGSLRLQLRWTSSLQAPEFGKTKFGQYSRMPVQCGPKGLPAPGFSFHNNGDGTFTNVSKKAPASPIRRALWLGHDLDRRGGDGWLDLYVAMMPPELSLHNNKDGTFAESVATGVSLTMTAFPSAPWRDRRRYLPPANSYFHHDFSGEHATLYRHDKLCSSRRLLRLQSRSGQHALCRLGTGFFDYDNEGWPTFSRQWHVYPQMENPAWALLTASACSYFTISATDLHGSCAESGAA